MSFGLLPLIVVMLAGYPAAQLERADQLVAGLTEAYPKIGTRGGAEAHVLAALAAERPGLPAEVLLAIAYRESHYHRLSGPRGKWPEAPRAIPKRRHYICGVLQATMATWAECVRVRDLAAGYRAGADQLEIWQRWCRSRVKPAAVFRCTMAGYARGGRAARRGDPEWSTPVLERARRMSGRPATMPAWSRRIPSS